MKRFTARMLVAIAVAVTTGAVTGADEALAVAPRAPAGIGLGCISDPPCTLTVVPPAVGSVYDIAGGGISNCRTGGGTCTATYAPGTLVTLTVYFIGYSFDYTGCHDGTETGLRPEDLSWRCSVRMLSNKTVTVTSTPGLSFTVTVVKDGNGTGTVDDPSALAMVDCGQDCTETRGQQLSQYRVIAIPDPDSLFAGFAGCDSIDPDGTCRYALSAGDRTITATFQLKTYALDVLKGGTGQGTVTSAPAGILCGADCSQIYDIDTSVILTAAAAAGSTFAGWSGGGCSGALVTCTVLMSGARAVTATFDLTPTGGGGDGGGGGGGNGGGDGGGGNGGAVDEAVDADLLGVKSAKTKLGKRLLKIELDAEEQVEVVLELVHKGKVIARKRIATFRPGHRVVKWVLKNRVRAGKARLEIELADGAGNELDFARKVTIKPRR